MRTVRSRKRELGVDVTAFDMFVLLYFRFFPLGPLILTLITSFAGHRERCAAAAGRS